jgi:N-acetylgalactosamine kinase
MPSSRNNQPIACIIMCGGRGTRMGSATTPKVCFPISGVPAIVRSIRTYRSCGIHTFVVVVGAQAGQVLETTGREFPDLLFAFQAEQRGTGDAARVGFAPLERMGFDGPVMITAGDKMVEVPAILKLKTEFYRAGADCAFMVSRKTKGSDQGRVAFDEKGQVRGIYELSDIRLARLYESARRLAAGASGVPAQDLRALCLAALSSPEKLAKRVPALWELAQKDGTLSSEEIGGAVPPGADAFDVAGQRVTADELEAGSRFCNESFYLFDPRALSEGLQRLTRRPGREEEYLTDIINILANPAVYGLQTEPAVCPVPVDEPGQIQGFNTPDQLMAIEHYMSRKLASVSPAQPPAVVLGRNTFRPAGEWIRLFTEMPPKFRATLRGIYGESDGDLAGHRSAYLRVLRRFARRYGVETRAIVVRAPGSVNLMGRHVDNRGGYVNLMNIGRETLLVAAPRDDDEFHLCHVESDGFPDARFSLREEVAQLDWEDWLSFVQSSRVRRMVLDSRGDWSNYVRAAVLRLQQHFRQVPLRGMNCAVLGNIPPAAGLGASVALLVAASDACIALNGLNVNPQAFIDLCGEGEWYVSGPDAASARAGMKVGGRGRITTVRYLPFEVQQSVPFPDEYRLAICHCPIPEPVLRQAAGLKRQQIATFDLALLLIRDRFPQYAHLLDRLRDLNTRRLGVTQKALYAMLLALPERVTPAELPRILSSAHRDRLEEILATHAAPDFYELRSATLFCMAECARSEMFSRLVEQQKFAEIGLLMSRSHEAERVASLVDGRMVPYTWRASDEVLHGWMADLESEDPDRVLRAQVCMQPGRYGCGASETDEMLDVARSVPGVCGAQVSGIGVAGCIMVFLEADAVHRLKRTLTGRFYAPRHVSPDITVCTPIASAGLLGA